MIFTVRGLHLFFPMLANLIAETLTTGINPLPTRVHKPFLHVLIYFLFISAEFFLRLLINLYSIVTILILLSTQSRT